MNALKPLGQSALSHRRPAVLDRFWFGAAYYPEHWDAATRAEDAARMAAAGFNLVRMGEFAWDRLEPEEGRWDFAFFDETIAQLAAKGVQTMFCTPTAAPPVWLTRRHPEILAVRADNVALQHGSRQHACLSSPLFREHSRRITRVLAGHFRDNPCVVAWQTDNELYCHFSECHCASCQTAFQDFLRDRYAGDVAALNRAWGAAFWALTYADFAEIQTPKANRPTHQNPSAQLDYHRFLADRVARFQHDQVEILRDIQPRWFITHNGIMSNVDYRGVFTQDLDVLGFDCYPMFCNDPDDRPQWQAFRLDGARAWSGNFIIPEQQSGPGGQAPYFHDNPEPGELRKMTYASIARGADSLLYFRWRTCRFGAEEYWCGILDHDNVPRRRYEEVKQIGAELRRLAPELPGTHVHLDAAVAGADLVNAEAHYTLSFGLPDPTTISEIVHANLYRRGYAVGVVHPADDLAGVKLYVIPHWATFDPAWVPGLEEAVRAGCTLVIGARTATRDLHNRVVSETIPGCLRKLAGVTVEEYGRKNMAEKRTFRLNCGGKTVAAEHWYETLTLDDDATALAIWTTRHLRGRSAVSVRKLGKGHVVYVGTYLNAAITELLLPTLVKLSGLKPLWPQAPKGVEVVRRQDSRKRIWFMMNHTDRRITLKKIPAGINLLTGRKTAGSTSLGPSGVLVVRSNAN